MATAPGLRKKFNMADLKSDREKHGAPLPVLTAQEESALWDIWFDAKSTESARNAARDKICTAHLPLCQSIVTMFWRNTQNIEKRDLQGDAQLAMLESFSNFDRTRGARFSTFIIPYIFRALIDHEIKFSGPAKTATSKLDRYLHNNWSRLNKEIDHIDPTLSSHKRFIKIAEMVKQAAPNIRPIDAKRVEVYALHRSNIGQAYAMDLIDQLFTHTQNPEHILSLKQEAAIAEDVQSVMLDFLETLDQRSRYIIERRYMQDGEAPILSVLGQEFGITAERVRQIESKGFEKLRTSLRNSGTYRAPVTEHEVTLQLNG